MPRLLSKNQQGPLRSGDRMEKVNALAFSRDNCPVRDVLDHIGDKWTVWIFCLWRQRTVVFQVCAGYSGHFQTHVDPDRRDLERDGLVSRQVFPTKPPSVEYSLTELGRDAMIPISALMDWAESGIPTSASPAPDSTRRSPSGLIADF